MGHTVPGLLWIELSYCTSFIVFENVIATTAVLTLMPKISFLLLLVSSLGADPFTVLFSQLVESWNSTNTRNLWLGMPEPLPETGVLANKKHRKIYTLTNWLTN